MAIILGTANDDVLTGTPGDDEIAGYGGIDVIGAGAGNDFVDGGAGDDVLRGGLGDDAFVVDSTADRVIEEATGGIDTIYSQARSYTLPANVEKLVLLPVSVERGSRIEGTGNDLDNYIAGNAGNNTLYGGAGDDILDGGGTDPANGFPFQTLDLLIGGLGNDTYFFRQGPERVSRGLYEYAIEYPNEGYDTILSLASVEPPFGGEGDGLPSNVEQLVLLGDGLGASGNASDNRIVGLNGGNFLSGRDGDDWLTGGGGGDRLYGDAGADLLFGEDGDDALFGGDGDDVMAGNAGVDTLNGGPGADRFIVFDLSGPAGQPDKITDFYSGADTIDFRFIDADPSLSGDQAFTYVGYSDNERAPGTLRLGYIEGSGIFLFGYIDADSVPDVLIDVGTFNVAAADLLL